MNCRYCGNELPEGAATCPICGGSAPSTSESQGRAADQGQTFMAAQNQAAAQSPATAVSQEPTAAASSAPQGPTAAASTGLPEWNPPDALARRPDEPQVSSGWQQKNGFQQHNASWQQSQPFQQQIPQQQIPYQQPPQQQGWNPPVSQSGAGLQAPQTQPKERLTYILLGIFLGGLGVHNFYAGYTGRAVTQLILTLFFFWLIIPIVVVSIWVIIELIVVTRDANGVPFG